MQYLMAEMATAGILPDWLTVGNMINAYADANQPRRAAAVMQSYIDAGGKVQCHRICVAVYRPCIAILSSSS